MSQADDFIIQDGVLQRYRGTDRVVRVPEGVCGIRWEAFIGHQLLEVYLPEGLVWLPDLVFYDQVCLWRLVLPASLRIVPPRLCYRAEDLTEVVIPEGIVVLSDQAFSVTGLKHVEIPDSVRSIGESCFEGCPRLRKVSLGQGVQCLRRNAFASCGNLRTISLPASLRYIGNNAFLDCHNLRSVRMKSGLLSVGSSVFENCPNLNRLVFPDTLENLPPDAFERASALERVTLRGNRVEFCDPHSPRNQSDPEPPLAPVIRAPRLRPEWIPAASRSAALKGWREMMAEGWPLDPEIAEAWEACAAGTGPDSSGKPAAAFQIVDGILCGVASPDGRVAVPEGVIGIRAEAFQETAVREVWLPDSVQWIQPGAFEGCRQLREVRLPAGLTRIPDRLFHGCRNLKYIRFADRVTYIGREAFAETGLETVELPLSLEVTGIDAFNTCTRLRHVRFPEGLREIRLRAFANCGSLTEVALPDSLELLEGAAFEDCTALEQVRLGARLRYFAEYAFHGCGSLKEVTSATNLCFLMDECFADCSDHLRVELACSFVDLEFMSVPPWIIAPNADPTILSVKPLLELLRGFVSEDGQGFRYEEKYLDLLRSHKREFWNFGEILRFLLRHDLLEREEIPDCLDALQKKNLPGLVVEVLEYCRRRFQDPAALLLLD